MGYKVAVVGATGAVGREILTTLSEREFPADDVQRPVRGVAVLAQVERPNLRVALDSPGHGRPPLQFAARGLN